MEGTTPVRVPSETGGTGGALGGRSVGPDAVPAAAHWLVWSFLVAFVVCAIGGLEIWPLTGFRLFSSLRHDTRTVWVADTVRSDGSEKRLWFTELPRSYQGFGLIMGGFRRLPAQAQRATCEAWLSEAQRISVGVTALRIYSLAWEALPRIGDRAPPPDRTLTYACH
jgi:hypothetical protein